MADAYGVIVVGKSRDFKGDLRRLTEQLNKIGDWCSSCGEFVTEGDRIYYREHGFSTQYPTVYPEVPIGYSRWENREKVDFKPIEEIGDDDYGIECEWELELAPIPLAEICRSLAPFIERGRLLISASANEKARYAYFEELCIQADGAGRRSRRINSAWSLDEENEEEVHPGALQDQVA